MKLLAVSLSVRLRPHKANSPNAVAPSGIECDLGAQLDRLLLLRPERRAGLLLIRLRRIGQAAVLAIEAAALEALGYAKSLNARPRIEGIFGWLKRIGSMKKVKLRGTTKVLSGLP